MLKQLWSTIQPISTKGKITSHLTQLTEHLKNTFTTYDIVTPCPGLGQTQKSGGVRQVLHCYSKK